jgi:signal transduction histidine kinase
MENKKEIPWQEIFKRIDMLASLADATANRVRKLCTELRPSILDDLGLVAAIEWQAREFQTRTNIDCKIVRQFRSLDIGDAQATSAFRIFQEILTNVARHSGADKVAVILKMEKAKLILQVKDNGKGISENKIAHGGSLGILGMRERAALVGGELAIRGKSGKGTTVSVMIPLGEKAELK